ncbi:MAG: Rieske (2Fe-2S) protein [Candidatus Eiseniibacteriota bacterium]|jgi:nitrite reductase/ring-hydroxylating ferredoxin subunit
MEHAGVRRNLLQRIFGIAATGPPRDRGCWSYGDGAVTVDLARAPELVAVGGAVRLEGHELPERLLVVRANDGTYRAYRNRCEHGGRRLDPTPDGLSLHCCSLGRSTYDVEGNPVSGPAKRPVTVYPARVDAATLVITLRDDGGRHDAP